MVKHPTYRLLVLLIALFLASCGTAKVECTRLTDDQLLDTIQYRTFQYFWDGAEPNSGLARERIHMDGVYPQNDKHIVTSGGSGFGLMALVVGMERGFITREPGVWSASAELLDFWKKVTASMGRGPTGSMGRLAG